MHYTNDQARETIEQTIHSARDRMILTRRFVDGICYEPLAEEFDMSVRQIDKAAEVRRLQDMFRK